MGWCPKERGKPTGQENIKRDGQPEDEKVGGTEKKEPRFQRSEGNNFGYVEVRVMR